MFAAVPVIRRHSAHLRTLLAASAILLTTYVLLGILSIGVYYLPSAASDDRRRVPRTARAARQGDRVPDPAEPRPVSPAPVPERARQG